MTRMLLSVPLLATSVAATFAAPPVPRNELVRAQELVQQLGSPVYGDRDTATRELREMGRHALPALANAAKLDPDPEVRTRCEWLIPFAKADELTSRITAFLEDTDPKREHNLPGWKPFSAATGDTPATRKLFTELLATSGNRNVLTAIPIGTTELSRQLTYRQQELYTLMYPQQLNGTPVTRYTPTREDVATLLLAETLLSEQQSVRAGIQVSSLVYQQQIRPLFGDAPELTAMTNLLVRWLDTRDGPNGLITAMNVAGNLSLKQTANYAAKVIESKNPPVYSRAQAIMMIGKVGAKDRSELLVKLLDDATAIRTIPNQGETQIRDLALAMLLILSGEDTADYGFRTQSTASTSRFYYWNYRFATDEERKKAFEKWKTREVKK